LGQLVYDSKHNILSNPNRYEGLGNEEEGYLIIPKVDKKVHMRPEFGLPLLAAIAGLSRRLR